MVTIKSVKPQDNYTLFLEFSDGTKGDFDVKPYLDKGIFKQLLNVSLFKSVTVRQDDETIEWANGADLCPDCVYLKTKFI